MQLGRLLTSRPMYLIMFMHFYSELIQPAGNFNMNIYILQMPQIDFLTRELQVITQIIQTQHMCIMF